MPNSEKNSMTNFDTTQIDNAQIDRFSGKVAFSVVFLPRTDYATRNELRVVHDSYFLRTGEKRETILEKIKSEFGRYGISEGSYNPLWISGSFAFSGNEVVLEVDEDTIKGFNYWVPQGILGEVFRERQGTFPRIRTNIKRTGKLYKNTFHDITDTRETDEGLVNMLRNETVPCSIMLTSEFLNESDAWNAGRGRLPGDIRIMNYGRIWGRFSTYFEDPNDGKWYQLLNKDCISESQREDYMQIYKRTLPELGKISGIGACTFRECDKVPAGRGFLYFDGSVKDAFRLLKESGVKLEEGIFD